MLETGFELLANLPENSLVACSCLRLGTRDWGKIFAWGRKHTHIYTVLLTTFRVPYAVLRDVGEQFWCFLLADLSVGVQTAARAPLCPLFCRNPQVTSGKESLADGWGRARRRPGQPDGTELIILYYKVFFFVCLIFPRIIHFNEINLVTPWTRFLTASNHWPSNNNHSNNL